MESKIGADLYGRKRNGRPSLARVAPLARKIHGGSPEAARDPAIIPPGRAAVGAFLLAPVGAKWLAGEKNTSIAKDYGT